MFGGLVFGEQIGLEQLGAVLFEYLRTALLLTFWVIVPLMTADCLSREKRDGTLDLLLLTPLTLLDIIIGKAAVHILRAVTLFLAGLPIFGLPFIFGGVGWPMFVVAVVYLSNAVLLGIAAGIYSSTKGGTATQVMVTAEGYALVLAAFSAFWTHALGGHAIGSIFWLGVFVCFSSACSFALFALVLKLGRDRLKETWQQDIAAPEQPEWVKIFSTSDFWRTVFQWDTSKTLDRNPIAWLQEYSWTARLTKWGWMFGLIFVEFVILLSWDRNRSQWWQVSIISALALGVAFSAVGSFRRETDTGLLEIMMVTPLSARQIVTGRLWGICCHYLGAVAALSVGCIGDRVLNWKIYQGSHLNLIFPNPFAFLAIMVAGIYLSLFRLNFLIAWLMAWSFAFLLPNVITVALGHVPGIRPLTAVLIPSMCQIALAVVCWFLVCRRMRLRSFVVSKPDRTPLF